MRPIVIIESPYAGDVARNLAYARAALYDCLVRGEAPYASHALYTQPGVLDDRKPEERMRGIEAGFEFRRFAARTVVYMDLGLSAGMSAGVVHAVQLGQPVEYRTLSEWAEVSALLAAGVRLAYEGRSWRFDKRGCLASDECAVSCKGRCAVHPANPGEGQ